VTGGMAKLRKAQPSDTEAGVEKDRNRIPIPKQVAQSSAFQKLCGFWFSHIKQLVYLGDPALHFITCDGGYSKRTKKSAQAARICKASMSDLEVAGRVEALIAKITS